MVVEVVGLAWAFGRRRAPDWLAPGGHALGVALCVTVSMPVVLHLTSGEVTPSWPSTVVIALSVAALCALVAAEVRAVAEEIAADPRYGDDEPLGPDEDARARFREFARKLGE